MTNFLHKWTGTAVFFQPNGNAPTCFIYSRTLSPGKATKRFSSANSFPENGPYGFAKNGFLSNIWSLCPYRWLHVWSKRMFGKKTVSYCDNLGAAQAWASFKSQRVAFLDLLSRMAMIAAVQIFCFTIRHVAGLDHSIANLLLWFQIQRFRALAPNAEPCRVPSGKFFHIWGRLSNAPNKLWNIL